MSQQWVAGIHAVTELIQRHPGDVLRLLLQQDRRDKRMETLLALATRAGIKTETVSRQDLDVLVGSTHQGVVAQCSVTDVLRPESWLPAMLENLSHEPLLLVLDEITDPHNFGACLRSADAAGVDAVIIPRDNAAPVNMTVRKVASGAVDTVPIVAVTNLARTLKLLKDRGIWLVGAAAEAEIGIYNQDLTGPLALVMGSEGKGLRRLTRENCDFLVAIPMAGALSSLNVSVATGVCLFEAVRQRRGGSRS
ncbi:MAG: 23S rRNA (guanosine(2251)-2'-O)-methyltransferase RlmB [Pseudohongiellaceae bacterium]